MAEPFELLSFQLAPVPPDEALNRQLMEIAELALATGIGAVDRFTIVFKSLSLRLSANIRAAALRKIPTSFGVRHAQFPTVVPRNLISQMT